jgi:glycosyltransferase involved in cell wall biosynthesis
MTPLLSVAIPTHNRAKYAGFAIRSLLAFADPRLEVVVSDTSATDELSTLLRQGSPSPLDDPRLKYSRPSVPLDITGNHNSALSAATGHYVCLIGDDDTVTADALKAAEWALENDVEAIAPTVVANYVWPDFRSRFFGSRHASRLYFARSMGAGGITESEGALSRALANAVQGADGLPKLYHGIVKRTVLSAIRETSGSFIHGPSPDVSGALSIALRVKTFVSVDYPLTIPGASGGSNTGRSAMNQHKGSLGSDGLTRSFQAAGWSPGVPRIFSVETVWAHGSLVTLSKLAPSLVPRFNFARLIAICRCLHGEFAHEHAQATALAAQVIGEEPSVLRARIAMEMARFNRERIVRGIKRVLVPTAAGSRAYASGLSTIAEAPAAVSEHLARRGLRLEHVLAPLA